MTRKVFILDWKDMRKFIKNNTTCLTNSELWEIESHDEFDRIHYKDNLPLGYNIYLLHFPFTSLEAIVKLRKANNSSRIYVRDVRTLIRDDFLPLELKTAVNGIYSFYDKSDLEKIFGSNGEL